MKQPQGFKISTPAWLRSELHRLPGRIPTDEERMQFANALAARNHLAGTGGPFAALVVETHSGRVVSAGVNLVLASGLSSAHAEVVALSLAQAKLHTWNLAAHHKPLELVVNWRPCSMCLGAVLWSGVRRLVVAGDGPELEQLTGFDEGPVREDWPAQLERRGVALRTDVDRQGAIAVFSAFGRRTDATVYNAWPRKAI